MGCSPSRQLVSADALSVPRSLTLPGLHVTSGTCCTCQTRPGDSLSSRFHLRPRESCADVEATFSFCSSILRQVCFSLDTFMNLYGQCCPRRICYRRRSNNNSKNADDNRTAEESGDAWGSPGHAGPAPRTQARGEFSVCPAGEPDTKTGRCDGRQEGVGELRPADRQERAQCMRDLRFWKSQGRSGGGWGARSKSPRTVITLEGWRCREGLRGGVTWSHGLPGRIPSSGRSVGLHPPQLSAIAH